jgi:hypothetical protein
MLKKFQIGIRKLDENPLMLHSEIQPGFIMRMPETLWADNVKGDGILIWKRLRILILEY